MKELVLSKNEEEFILQSLQHDLRVDGRSPLEMRMVKINFGAEHGTVEAQLGTSRAIACVTADIVSPFPDRPTEGFLNFFVDFSPMAAPGVQTHKVSDKAVEMSRVVERGIRDSRAIDTEALCILAGEKVWAIRVDVHVTDHGGNLTDCVNLAAVTALLHFRRPDVAVVGNKVVVYSMDDRQPVKLSIHHIPLSLSFAFFKIEHKEHFVLDPGLKEEAVSQGLLTLTLNKHKELCCIQKAGGVAVSYDLLLRCAKMAAAKAEQLTSLINKRLKADEESDRNNLKLAGLEKYINMKMPNRVGEGKDALGNPLKVGGDGAEEGEIMDTDDEQSEG